MTELFFDGGKKQDYISYGIVLKEGKKVLYKNGDKIATRKFSSNMSEYFALIMGLNIALKLNISRLTVYGDSQTVIKQMKKNTKARSPNMLYLCDIATALADQFDSINFVWISRKMNKQADREGR